MLAGLLVMCPPAVRLTHRSPVQTVIRPVGWLQTGRWLSQTLSAPVVNAVSFLFSRYSSSSRCLHAAEFSRLSWSQTGTPEGLVLFLV